MSEKQRLIRCTYVPLAMILLMWSVFAWTYMFTVNVDDYGIFPRNFIGLRGILFSPFIHGGYGHIMNNTFPILILGTSIFYFYSKSAKYVFIYSILITGIWVWAAARPSIHIGASGVIYAWGAFFIFEWCSQ